MPVCRLSGEPSLDELLGDEIMDRVMARAGTDAAELRRQMTALAERLAEERPEAPWSRGGRR